MGKGQAGAVVAGCAENMVPNYKAEHGRNKN